MSSVSNCMKCGSPLPDEGDCPRCTASAPAPAEKVPSLLDKELNLDRRQPAAPPRVPGFSELSSTLKPPAVAPMATPKPPATPKVAAALPDFPPAAPKPRAPSPAAPVPVAPANVVASNAIEPTQGGTSPLHAPAPTPQAAPAKNGGSTTNGAAEEIHARPASRWRRFGAYLVDSVVVLGILAGYLWLAATVTGLQPPQAQLPGLDGLVQRVIAMESILVPGLILAVIVAIAYSAGCSILWQGRTLGRRLFGIRLVDKSGLGPSPRRTVIRAVLSVLSFALFLGGFWLALFDRRGQTLHDKLTSTFVVQPS